MIVVNEMEQVAYSEKKIEKSPWLPDDRPTAPKVKKSVFQVKKSKHANKFSVKCVFYIPLLCFCNTRFHSFDPQIYIFIHNLMLCILDR